MDQIAFLTILFDKEQTFKNSIQELDTIVSKMESGDLSLDESLKLFEKHQT